MSSLLVAPLSIADRPRLAEILTATKAFTADEVAVALELFDAVNCHAERSEGSPARHPELGEGSPVRHPERSEGSASPDYEFLGAYSAGSLAGYACFGPTPMTDSTFDLYWLAVHPDMQGLGVGRTLVRHVEQLLKSRGARMLVVETSSRTDYASTREFYARNGYAEAARVRDFYAPADDRIILTARLNEPVGGVATQ